jgi:hypothetical protein
MKIVFVPAVIFCVGVNCVPTTAASQGTHERSAFAYVSPQANETLNEYIAGVSKRLDARVVGALGRINETGRRLLALRSYLRSEGSIASKWSWSAEEIERYKTTNEFRNALAEVENVRKKFESLNPGYSLHVNTEVRSLEAQLKNWNETKSVQVAAEDLFGAAGTEISRPPYKTVPDQKSLASFERFLKNYKVVSPPTVAVPGLSPHGQLRAFDFQIKQGDKIIAGTNAAMLKDVWDGQGWTEKLRAAVTAASKKLTGPLASPREPWHYTYTP